jgi:hypothetical protein
VFDRYRSGWTIAGVLEQLGAGRDDPGAQSEIEAAVIDLIRNDTSSDALEHEAA